MRSHRRLLRDLNRPGIQTVPDYALFRALPGAGAALAPRLLVAFGEQRERYESAAEIQRFAGNRSRHREQWQQAVGPLATAMPHVLTLEPINQMD